MPAEPDTTARQGGYEHPPLTAFLSGPLTSRARLRAAAEDLRTIGWAVSSRWLQDTYDLTPGLLGPASDLDDQAADDVTSSAFVDIDEADVVIAFTAAAALDPAERAAALSAAAHAHLVGSAPGNLPGASGGRHVEVGYALGTGRHVLLVGAPENLFHRSPLVERHPDWHAASTALAARLVSQQRQRAQQAEAAVIDFHHALQDRMRQIAAWSRLTEDDLVAAERAHAAGPW